MTAEQQNISGLVNQSWDTTWEKVFQESEWGKYPAESLIRFVARNFYNRDRNGTHILEVGCGPGANVWYLAREGFQAYGIEGSRTAVDRAKKRFQDEGLSAQIEVGDIVKMPYADQFFDAVIDVECLTHNSTANMAAIFSEIKRVLKPNGLLYSRTFTDEVYVGKQQTQLGDNEYTDVSDGPFGGRGFVRLTSREDIDRLYGELFSIHSVDKLEYTDKNGEITISEWIIIGKNDK